MTLFAVLDVSGAGRVLGVFEDRARAQQLVERYPHYYKLHRVELNEISEEAEQWALDEEQREFLKGQRDRGA